LAHFAQHISGGYKDVVKAQHAVLAGKAVVHGFLVALQRGAGMVQASQKKGGGAVLHARYHDGVIDPCAPVMNHLKPLIR
jgi:hypothetical protein